MRERVRFERETAALAGEEREYELAVSRGEFGKALLQFATIADVPDAVFWLLQRSPTYSSMVKTLDRKYVYVGSLPADWDTTVDRDDDGAFKTGPLQGRRVIEIRYSIEGSYFFPFGAIGKFFGWDTMFIEPPPSHPPNRDKPATLTEKGEWIERIAHETTHAHRLVLGLRGAGKTPLERINAGIDDEIETRKTEGLVVGELQAQFPAFRPYQPATGRTERWAVERDLFTANLRCTYLEYFVLNERLRAARAQISAEDAGKYDAFVDRIDLSKRPLASYLTAKPRFVNPRSSKDREVLSTFAQIYPNLLLALRVLDARWRAVKTLGADHYHDAEIEAMRQEHARAYFDGITSYRRVP